MALTALAKNDPVNKSRRPITRKGSKTPVAKTAIQRKIPFREVISQVCHAADSMPLLQKRSKKNAESIKIKDLPKSKLKAIAKMIGIAVDGINGEDTVEDFILVRLKQLASSIVFEFMDQGLDWMSPLKTEVSFGPGFTYEDPPVEGTKLTRVGGWSKSFFSSTSYG